MCQWTHFTTGKGCNHVKEITRPFRSYECRRAQLKQGLECKIRKVYVRIEARDCRRCQLEAEKTRRRQHYLRIRAGRWDDDGCEGKGKGRAVYDDFGDIDTEADSAPDPASKTPAADDDSDIDMDTPSASTATPGANAGSSSDPTNDLTAAFRRISIFDHVDFGEVMSSDPIEIPGQTTFYLDPKTNLSIAHTWPGFRSVTRWDVPEKEFTDPGFQRLDPWAADRAKIKMESETRGRQLANHRRDRSVSPGDKRLFVRFPRLLSCLAPREEEDESIGYRVARKNSQKRRLGCLSEVIEAGRELKRRCFVKVEKNENSGDICMSSI